MRETGVSPFYVYDQFDVVHGGYVHMDLMVRQEVPAFLITSAQYFPFFEQLSNLMQGVGRVECVVFEPGAPGPSLRGMAWSICDFVRWNSRAARQERPFWGKKLWEQWR
jgi:hypothetical protein